MTLERYAGLLRQASREGEAKEIEARARTIRGAARR
jgi:hypothetical protein